jgi:hypothetical protein
MAAEAGLRDAEICFSEHSRLPLTAFAYPPWMSRLAPRWLSDNLLIVAGKRP